MDDLLVLPVMTIEQAKKAAGKKAAELVEDGMIIGLGTGSTAAYFIEALSKRKLNIKAVASSKQSALQAKKGNIAVIDIDSVQTIDMTVDGADEIDPQKRLIKGRGGALLREKIVASISRELIVIADETKLVSHLGQAPLPVEIVPFGYLSTIARLKRRGFTGKLRSDAAKPYVTENGHYIYDVQLDPQSLHLPDDHERILGVVGVVETGFFLNMAGRIVIGFLDGQVKVH